VEGRNNLIANPNPPLIAAGQPAHDSHLAVPVASSQNHTLQVNGIIISLLLLYTSARRRVTDKTTPKSKGSINDTSSLPL